MQAGCKKQKYFFYKKYASDYKNGKSLKGASVTNYDGAFGPFELVAAGADIVEQFVGSFDLNMYTDEKGENILFVLHNNTSKKSALYQIADDIERKPNGYTAMGNMHQIYIWKEPISNVFKDAAVEVDHQQTREIFRGH